MRFLAVIIFGLSQLGCGLIIKKNLPANFNYKPGVTHTFGCDNKLWKATHRKFRFKTLEECALIRGTVADTHINGMDGDLNMEIALDAEFADLTEGARNKNGWLRAEEVCYQRPAWYALDVRWNCRNAKRRRYSIPPVGTRVELIGRLVADCDHGCITEMHPVSFLSILPPY